MKWIEKYKAECLGLLRIMAGFMFSFHGVQKIIGFQKLLGVVTDFRPAFGTQMWFGGVIELIGGALILLGFRTRWVAFLCSGEMAVAYVQFHWKLQGGDNFFPAYNKGELAALYCFVFLAIAALGPGKWAIEKDK